MGWIERLNNSLRYIEDNLDGHISYDEAARLAYCSTYHYQRMFSFMADMTLSDYIRRRRLTLAALELQRQDSKVIDVALKYGYNSPTAFTRAFLKVHGVTPSEAKEKGASLKHYPPISFSISIRGGVAMDYRIEEREGFRLVGIKETVKTIDGYNFKRIPKLWEEVCKDKKFYDILSLSNENPSGVMGACANFNKDEFDYYIAASSDKKIPEGMTELNVEKGTWVIFTCRGIAGLQDTCRRVYTDWFPTSGYEHSGGAEIEWYSVGDTRDPDYLCEVWIPIVKK